MKKGYRKSPRSARVRKRISLTLKKYFKTHSPAFKGKHFSASKRKELSRKKIEFLRKNPAWLERKRKQMKEYCRKNPEFMRRTQKISLAYFRKHPEILEKRRKSIILAYKNPELRKKMSRIVRAKYSANPEIAKLIDRKVTLWWREHPNIKKERADELREFFLSNPEEFKKKFVNSKNNPFFPT